MYVALILILFATVCTVMTIQIWLGKPPGKRSKLRDENFLRSGTIQPSSPSGSYNLSAKGVFSAAIPGVVFIWTLSIADLLISWWPRSHFTREFVSLDIVLGNLHCLMRTPIFSWSTSGNVASANSTILVGVIDLLPSQPLFNS